METTGHRSRFANQRPERFQSLERAIERTSARIDEEVHDIVAAFTPIAVESPAGVPSERRIGRNQSDLEVAFRDVAVRNGQTIRQLVVDKRGWCVGDVGDLVAQDHIFRPQIRRGHGLAKRGHVRHSPRRHDSAFRR